MSGEKIPWREVGIATAVTSAICSAIAGVFWTAVGIAARNDERERNRVRWTDKNRWPHGE